MKKISLLVASFFLLFSCKNNLAKNEIWVGEGFSGFGEYKAVEGKKFLVATADKFASQAGAEILAKGGNAIDAAIASQMVLNVVEPQSSGIGGGLFLLYFDAKTKQSIYFNGRETAPREANEKIFLDKNGRAREFKDVVGGGLSVGTPGALKALYAAHRKYGKLPWHELFTPAIKISEDGFLLDEKIHVVLRQVPYLKRFEGMKIYFDEKSEPKKIGSVIKNYKLAETFRVLAAKGIEPFYKGRIAQDIVAAVRDPKTNPGHLSLADLANYKIKTGELICASYRVKYKICSMPAPSGGVMLLKILKILENFDLAKLKPSSLESVNLIAGASRLAYFDRGYAQFEAPSTTHLAIVDKSGNAVSMTSSIEYLFGSALVVDGFMLNNQLTDFSFTPEVNGKKNVNRLEPGKQPRSSMSPSFIFDQKNNLLMAVGSPGGPRITQFIVKTIVGHLDFGLDIQQAISLPNFVVINDRLELEDRTALVQLRPELEKLGYKIKVTDITSGLQGITVSGNKLIGGADPRRHGAVVGK
ncbi:MAG: gamma-glutamyltransferase family protein [Alphaproteobacteria bacterium]|nr:gamma-glutamyltransferase family protein [Alphaproteobacteria bacterium]